MLGENNKKLSQIIAISDQESPELKSFLHKLYPLLWNTKSSTSVETYHEVGKQIFGLLQHRPPYQTNIEITTHEDSTVVKIINEDMAFIIDSLLQEIKDNSLVVYDYVNSVISIKRDADGNFISIAESDNKESVVFFIINKLEQAQVDYLRQRLVTVLSKVRSCVQDWPAMMENTKKFAKTLSSFNWSDNHLTAEMEMLLNWLLDGNFIFLGYAKYEVESKCGHDENYFYLSKIEEGSLGILKERDPEEDNLVVYQGREFYIFRSNRLSVVHRRAHMDGIAIKQFDEKRNLLAEHHFLGFFTSGVCSKDPHSIPIIRKKVQEMEKILNFPAGGYSDKEVKSIVFAIRRDELFQMSTSELTDFVLARLAFTASPGIKLFVRNDFCGNFVTFVLLLPFNSYSPELMVKIEKILAEEFNGKIVIQSIYVDDVAKLDFILRVNKKQEVTPDRVDNIEQAIYHIAVKWSDRLKSIISSQKIEIATKSHLLQYLDILPPSYQELASAQVAFQDICLLEQVRKEGKVLANLDFVDHKRQLKIYIPLREKSIKFSEMLGIVQNMGVNIVDHQNYYLKLGQGDSDIWLHSFILEGDFLASEKTKVEFEHALVAALSRQISDDYTNSLIILAGLKVQEVNLIKSFTRYLKQIKFPYAQSSFIKTTLSRYPEIVRGIIQLFHLRFNPHLSTNGAEEIKSSDNREAQVAQAKEHLDLLLKEVSNASDYIALCKIIELIFAIVRTNFYKNRDFISLKFNSSKISDLPLPIPFREIFVYSAKFEGIHLRGGKVARGGLRWSDRSEDFRTEVLGLMKAQMTKNTLIVPVGAKGGFVLNQEYIAQHQPNINEHVKQCYQDFLRALLDLTDNICDGTIIPPAEILCLDEPDHYLVVAADKGTASFSNFANAVSAEYNYWLGDAFASGGSTGYDHKKMGITALGAWVAASRNFWTLGRPMESAEVVQASEISNQSYNMLLPSTNFTAIGIGDMSGDVFGNGLLISNQVLLIGAFNHIHIFIDPNPDAEISHQERKRLFSLPRSTWLDYSPNLISEGGGVFLRTAKSIPISNQMKARFGITQNDLTPDQMIKIILRTKVDMIWNGGIGTFVKARSESNDLVGDLDNDNIRVNGREIKALMILEGGNLGCTQLGRVEYARNGGLINTDFIDNAAGVTCSDFEVNIKIVLNSALGIKISLIERNELLAEMQNHIAQLILHNYLRQRIRALAIEKSQAEFRLEQHWHLIRKLEASGQLDRQVENLPTDEEMTTLCAERAGLEKPQLAVLISYARMDIYNALTSSTLLDHEYFLHYLLGYFPEIMRKKFEPEIRAHPLRREIISNYVTNSIINRMGVVFVNNIIENTGLSIIEVVKIYMIVRDAFRIKLLWDKIDDLEYSLDVKSHLRLVRIVQKFTTQACFWFFRNYTDQQDIRVIVDLIGRNADYVLANIDQLLDSYMLTKYLEETKDLTALGLNEAFSRELASFNFLTYSLDIISIHSQNPNLNIDRIANVLFEVGSTLEFYRIYEATSKLDTQSYWRKLALRSMFDQLHDYQRLITIRVLQEEDAGSSAKELIEKWLSKNNLALARYYNLLSEVKATPEFDLSRLVIVVSRIEEILKKSA